MSTLILVVLVLMFNFRLCSTGHPSLQILCFQHLQRFKIGTCRTRNLVDCGVCSSEIYSQCVYECVCTDFSLSKLLLAKFIVDTTII